jgi:hypothetical protein
VNAARPFALTIHMPVVFLLLTELIRNDAPTYLSIHYVHNSCWEMMPSMVASDAGRLQHTPPYTPDPHLPPKHPAHHPRCSRCCRCCSIHSVYYTQPKV